MLSWLVSKSAGEKSASAVTSPVQNEQQLEEVLRAAEFVFSDDFREAEAVLAGGFSPYHMLGKGMMVLLKSSLGFEEDLLQDAGEYLDEAETSSRTALQRALVGVRPQSPSLYHAGISLKLCYAQAKLANAVRAAVSEKMTEYLVGLYKIRQSYMALRAIIDEEASYIVKHGNRIDTGYDGLSPNSSSTALGETSVPLMLASGTDSHLSRTLASSASKDTTGFSCLNLHPNSPLLQSTSNAYVYSGSHLCFGAMLVILSFVPTAFQQVLKVVGFRGHKTRGYEMLWHATRFHNIHGAVAGLLLLSLYNAVRGVCDILDEEVYPKERCEKLLEEMKQRYPKSAFWMLEEARALISKHELEEAIAVLERPAEKSVKQLESLLLLEKSMCQMFIHDYEACSESFIKIISLNKYSHALYYYDAAGCQIQLYRQNRDSNLEKANLHKEKARRYLDTALHGVDRKKLYATELPFDSFVVRKINKWTNTAAKRGIDIIDAVGVSPLEEITYIYGGHKNMSPLERDQSISAICWFEKQAGWAKEEVDERAICSLLKAVVQRNAGDIVGARRTLNDIIKLDKKMFEAKGRDDWPLPSAHYEMAVISWLEKDLPGYSEAEKVKECEQWLSKVTRCGSYELDSRILIKAKAAQDVLANYKAKRVAK